MQLEGKRLKELRSKWRALTSDIESAVFRMQQSLYFPENFAPEKVDVDNGFQQTGMAESAYRTQRSVWESAKRKSAVERARPSEVRQLAGP